MSLSRRDFLRLSGLLAAGAGACTPLYRQVAGVPGPVGEPVRGAQAAHRLLGRAAFGASDWDLARIEETGVGGWLEEQLATERPQDDPAEILLRPLDALELEAADLEGWEKEEVLRQLRTGTLLRQIYSRRQLYERMVEFWTDHFNIHIEKGECWLLKIPDDREVVRANALGRFEEMLLASAHSPAMLIYLDNQANEASAPNENYAREVMELHTLGVAGGYSQSDVMELARCLTGWTVKEHFWKGQFTFKPGLHDQGRKRVLGEWIEPGGEREAETVLRRLAAHRSTAEFIAEKLVGRFITDRPLDDAPGIVSDVAAAFRKSDGDLRAVSRVLFLDGLLPRLDTLPAKIKRPLDLVTSPLRALHATTDGGEGLQGELAAMGHLPFDWPSPDGPPDTAAAWSAALLPRWQFAIRLARGEIEGTEIPMEAMGGFEGEKPSEQLDSMALRLLGRPADGRMVRALNMALEEGGPDAEQELAPLMVAGLVASPEFQWR